MRITYSAMFWTLVWKWFQLLWFFGMQKLYLNRWYRYPLKLELIKNRWDHFDYIVWSLFEWLRILWKGFNFFCLKKKTIPFFNFKCSLYWNNFLKMVHCFASNFGFEISLKESNRCVNLQSILLTQYQQTQKQLPIIVRSIQRFSFFVLFCFVCCYVFSS